jgi:hypothetical protein
MYHGFSLKSITIISNITKALVEGSGAGLLFRPSSKNNCGVLLPRHLDLSLELSLELMFLTATHLLYKQSIGAKVNELIYRV